MAAPVGFLPVVLPVPLIASCMCHSLRAMIHEDDEGGYTVLRLNCSASSAYGLLVLLVVRALVVVWYGIV